MASAVLELSASDALHTFLYISETVISGGEQAGGDQAGIVVPMGRSGTLGEGRRPTAPMSSGTACALHRLRRVSSLRPGSPIASLPHSDSQHIQLFSRLPMAAPAVPATTAAVPVTVVFRIDLVHPSICPADARSSSRVLELDIIVASSRVCDLTIRSHRRGEGVAEFGAGILRTLTVLNPEGMSMSTRRVMAREASEMVHRLSKRQTSARSTEDGPRQCERRGHHRSWCEPSRGMRREDARDEAQQRDRACDPVWQRFTNLFGIGMRYLIRPVSPTERVFVSRDCLSQKIECKSSLMLPGKGEERSPMAGTFTLANMFLFDQLFTA
ncbi:hypothetical protein BV25DRAFT_1843254 [Artomyces pyxidatus]|uniref:Uncharacterized protein n=1 Tax=Artomyces pyxidatus TaxID=48021 RepID=A0ACB8SGE3_9AGAM|nr:hypothetical protein BV25DRAFT_1843254 [Artomyces pyxidatus]